MRYYIFYAKYTAILELSSLTTYLQIIIFEHAVIVPFSVHLTYKTEFLVFPLVQPAANPSEHNTNFTRSQNLQTPVAAFLLYLSQTCSGLGLPVCRCSLVQFGFPQPFWERCYVTHWLLGEMLITGDQKIFHGNITSNLSVTKSASR